MKGLYYKSYFKEKKSNLMHAGRSGKIKPMLKNTFFSMRNFPKIQRILRKPFLRTQAKYVFFLIIQYFQFMIINKLIFLLDDNDSFDFIYIVLKENIFYRFKK